MSDVSHYLVCHILVLCLSNYSGSGGAKLDESISEISPSALAKQLNINYTATLEKRIRRELEEQGTPNIICH